MNPRDISESDILKLVEQRAEQKAATGENWLVNVCVQQIELLESDIARLRQLIDLCKKPDTMRAIELFVGKK